MTCPECFDCDDLREQCETCDGAGYIENYEK